MLEEGQGCGAVAGVCCGGHRRPWQRGFGPKRRRHPHTAHTTNPVPIWVEGSGHQEVQDGILADVAPTVLALMGVSQPEEMTGRSLV